jgi:hypothetical protein
MLNGKVLRLIAVKVGLIEYFFSFSKCLFEAIVPNAEGCNNRRKKICGHKG